MATYTLSVPKSGLVSPTSWGTRTAVKNQIDKILTNYGSFIKFASENSKLPKEVIASFIAIESGGNATAGGASSATQGLMQWNRNFAKNTLEAEKRLGRLTEEETAKLKKYGITFDSANKTRTITQADQVKPELNILIGSILLGQFADSMFDGGKIIKDASNKKIDWANSDGELRLDRIICVYNAGAYGDTGKKAMKGNYKDAKAMAEAVNPITSAYIKKMLGLNGAMDVSTKELADKFNNL